MRDHGPVRTCAHPSKLARTPERLARAGEVDAQVQAWVGGRSIEDCVATLNEAQIACGPIVRIDGYPREANLEHRGMIRRLRDPVTGGDIVCRARRCA